MSLHNLLLKLRLFFSRTDGASAIEYALIVAMVALVVGTFITPLGDSVNDLFTAVQTALEDALPAP